MLHAVAAIVIIILKHLLVIMSTLVLHLKAADSFLESNQCIHEHNSVEVQENPDY